MMTIGRRAGAGRAAGAAGAAGARAGRARARAHGRMLRQGLPLLASFGQKNAATSVWYYWLSTCQRETSQAVARCGILSPPLFVGKFF